MAVEFRSSSLWASTVNSKLTDAFRGNEYNKKRVEQRSAELLKINEDDKSYKDFYENLVSLRNSTLLELLVEKYQGEIALNAQYREAFFARMNALAKKSSTFNGYLVNVGFDSSKKLDSFKGILSSLDETEQKKYSDLATIGATVKIVKPVQVETLYQANLKIIETIQRTSNPSFFSAFISLFTSNKEQKAVDTLVESLDGISDLLAICNNKKLRQTLDKKLNYYFFGLKFSRGSIEAKTLRKKLLAIEGVDAKKLNNLLDDNYSTRVTAIEAILSASEEPIVPLSNNSNDGTIVTSSERPLGQGSFGQIPNISSTRRIALNFTDIVLRSLLSGIRIFLPTFSPQVFLGRRNSFVPSVNQLITEQQQRTITAGPDENLEVVLQPKIRNSSAQIASLLKIPEVNDHVTSDDVTSNEDKDDSDSDISSDFELEAHDNDSDISSDFELEAHDNESDISSDLELERPCAKSSDGRPHNIMLDLFGSDNTPKLTKGALIMQNLFPDVHTEKKSETSWSFLKKI